MTRFLGTAGQFEISQAKGCTFPKCSPPESHSPSGTCERGDISIRSGPRKSNAIKGYQGPSAQEGEQIKRTRYRLTQQTSKSLILGETHVCHACLVALLWKSTSRRPKP